MSAKSAFVPRPAVILVAEDDSNDVLLLQRAFAKASLPARVLFVSNGAEVIRYLSGEAPFDDRAICPFPQLLLLDLNMPGMGGLEVLQWLEANPQVARLRVVVFSSCVAPEHARQAARLGAHSCVTKPLCPLDLLPMLQELSNAPALDPGRQEN